MQKDFTVIFSSINKKAARDGILFPLTAVDSAYATGPISYVTTKLLEQLGYLTPNAFGGLSISPQVSEQFLQHSKSSRRVNKQNRATTPYVGNVETPTGTHTVWISPNSTCGKHTLYLPEEC